MSIANANYSRQSHLIARDVKEWWEVKQEIRDFMIADPTLQLTSVRATCQAPSLRAIIPFAFRSRILLAERGAFGYCQSHLPQNYGADDLAQR